MFVCGTNLFFVEESSLPFSGCREAVTPSLPSPGSWGASMEGSCSLGPQGNLKVDLDLELPLLRAPHPVGYFCSWEMSSAAFNKHMELGALGGPLKSVGGTMVFHRPYGPSLP